ncbi:hypothetical protein BVI434_1860027 [Burkholderia vietnamiensis]|nr:hypothetical protein BVI434_1860027 [Burkholderia vietnamiensis]
MSLLHKSSIQIKRKGIVVAVRTDIRRGAGKVLQRDLWHFDARLFSRSCFTGQNLRVRKVYPSDCSIMRVSEFCIRRDCVPAEAKVFAGLQQLAAVVWSLGTLIGQWALRLGR